MNDLKSLTVPARDDWEDWTDEETIATSTIDHKPLVQLGSPVLTSQPSTSRKSKGRQSNSSSKIQRLRSRKRQRQQNEKLGIRLDTDMTRFHKGPQHIAQFVPSPQPGHKLPDYTTAKFVDTSALRALEGSPNSASRGNWAWLKGQGGSQSPQPNTPVTHHQQPHHYSPDGAKIVIGISMAEEDAASRTISPQTATVATPINKLPTGTANTAAHQHPQSAWSPDTEDGFSPARYLHGHQGIYAQATAPPVPAVPSTFAPVKNAALARLSRGEIDDDDQFTPVTLFEEDGRKSPTSAVSKISPQTTRSRSGWWDHVRTPFKERFSPITGANAKSAANEATSPDEWWKSTNEKKAGPMSQQNTALEAASSSVTLHPDVPIIREPSPAMASSSRSPPTSEPRQEQSHSEKARAAMEEDHVAEGDMPPPYERNPSSKQTAAYHSVFPPPQNYYGANQHPFQNRLPSSPGLDGTMSSQCAKMSDVPLTPAPFIGAESHKTGNTIVAADVPLPDRVAGTYAGDHFATVQGGDPASRVEKTRRRHEKEDVLAHKAGGFWKGRGCIPENGCYGRSGREGRQRRRMWLWLCIVFWVLTIVGVVLGVVLSRKLQSHAAQPGGVSSGDSSSSTTTATASGGFLSSLTPSANPSSSSVPNTPVQPPSVWVNLTDFPPIPTGLATVVGADNSEAISGCVTPATLWSCSLPPEQQAANKPSEADQPMFIFQIQYDNNTRMLWDTPNGTPPTPSTSSSATTTAKKTSTATSTTATPTDSLSRRDDDTVTLYDTAIQPNPEPPTFEEMWFLGNYTDGIVSANKSGEPTPFYISFFTSLNDTAGPNMLTDASTASTYTVPTYNYSGSGGLSGVLPVAPHNDDGTGVDAQLHPYPYQQPLRLYDRGLPTEHYGFYSYFNKTIYVTDVEDADSTDPDGGVRQSSATWYTEWSQTRFVVKIWTKKGTTGGARLIGGDATNTTTPGSFLYPITIGEDTHGGDSHKKYAFAYGVDADGMVNMTNVHVIDNMMNYSSPVINPAWPNGDISWGGTDGGVGGCRCEWVNWVNDIGEVDETFG